VAGTLAGLLLSPRPVSAQIFQGRVVDEEGGGAVEAALIRLVDADEGRHAVTISDENGRYRLEAPEPGVYRLEAARLGYQNFASPLLEASSDGATYPVDLLMASAPIELPGIRVEARRTSDAEADRQVRLMTGLHPASLRYRPIGYEQIQDHLAKAHTLVDVMRWDVPSLIVTRRSEQGPCFSLRGRGCLPVYLNGLPLHRDFIEAAPLEMTYRIVIVTPTDGSIVYPGGAVLLYTEAWLR
jgi:hypothetical protein